jgi:hypothetical protein
MQKDYNPSIKPVKEKLAKPLFSSLPLPALAPAHNPATIKTISTEEVSHE